MDGGMSDIERDFQRLLRRQWWHARFCVRNGGAFVDIGIRILRFGFSINRDHRSPRLSFRLG